MTSINHKKQLINNTLWIYAGKLITQILSLVATILVIKELPVDTYGTYTFLFGLFFIYQLFITSPIKNVLLRYVPELHAQGEQKVINKLILYSIFLSAILILLFSYLLFYFQIELGSFFNIESFTASFKPFIIFVFCYALKILSENIIAAYLKHPLSARANVVVVIVRAASYILLLNKISVALLLYIEALVSIIFVIWILPGLIKEIVRKQIKDSTEEQGDIHIKKRVVRFYLLSFFSELGYGIIGKTSDHYIIAAMSSPFFVGLYGFALKIFEMFYKVLPFREFESVLKPIFFNKFGKENNDAAINEFYVFAVKVLLPLFMFPVAYFLIFGKGVISIVFDPKYLPAFWVTCVSLIGIIINGFFYPLNLVIQLKERVEINLYSRVIVVFSIFAGIYFMKLYGIVGVAAATVLGELLKNLFMFFMLQRHIKITYSRKLFINYGALLFILLGIFFPLSYLSDTPLVLVLGSAIFVVLYVLFLINLHPFKKQELEQLSKVLGSNDKIAKILSIINPVIIKLTIRKFDKNNLTL